MYTEGLEPWASQLLRIKHIILSSFDSETVRAELVLACSNDPAEQVCNRQYGDHHHCSVIPTRKKFTVTECLNKPPSWPTRKQEGMKQQQWSFSDYSFTSIVRSKRAEIYRIT